MILTCPSCATKYVVKDGAIPPQGRQVRCAHCKESWHQMPEGEDTASDGGVPPQDIPSADQRFSDASAEETERNQTFERDVMASQDAGIAAEPVPDMANPAEPSVEPDEAVAHGEVGGPPVAEDSDDVGEHDYAQVEPVGQEFEGATPAVATPAAEEDFAVHIPDDEDQPRGKGRLLIVLVLLIALAAAAAYFFAPASMKSKLGIAGAGKTPLELMVTTSDRQQLASGNELLAISGRVINPTAEEQAVPPIRAELRNKVSKKLVYQWTIAPPARSLPPGGSASFNSAEVDIPPGGDELTVTLANAAG